MLDSSTVALSFAMIVFPTFVIIPSVISLFEPIPAARRRYTLFYLLPFIVAGISLIIAVIFSGIGLAKVGGFGEYMLVVIMSVCTMALLVFLRLLSQYLREQSIKAAYKKAREGRLV